MSCNYGDPLLIDCFCNNGLKWWKLKEGKSSHVAWKVAEVPPPHDTDSLTLSSKMCLECCSITSFPLWCRIALSFWRRNPQTAYRRHSGPQTAEISIYWITKYDTWCRRWFTRTGLTTLTSWAACDKLHQCVIDNAIRQWQTRLRACVNSKIVLKFDRPTPVHYRPRN